MTSTILFFGFFSISLNLLAAMVPLVKHWKDEHLHGFVSFSAGVLLATAFLHLLPEAMEKGTPHTTGVYILASFLFLFILEKFVMIHPCEEVHCDYHTVGLAAFVGMMIHTFIDGLALGTALFVPGLGQLVFFAIMAHKIPSSFALASVLRKARWKTANVLLLIAVFGMMIPAGALASQTLLSQIGDKATGAGLALSLGTFLYISTSDFLPEVHRSLERRFQNLVGFLIGIFLVGLLTWFIPHH